MKKDNVLENQITSSGTEDGKLAGPTCYKNWMAELDNKSSDFAYEYPLFTDSELTGEILEKYGPYKLLNTCPIYKTQSTPAMVLRVSNHLRRNDASEIVMDKTDVTNYHGGELKDEISALFSLCLGIRLKAGECMREFDINGDPKGKPCYYLGYYIPIINRSNRGSVLPYSKSRKCINDATLVQKIPDLKPDEASTIVKSARLYQDAIWVAESEPALSWLLLVSAIETAAEFRYKTKYSALEVLKEFKPEFVESLNEYDTTKKLVNSVANEFSNIFGATKKFVDFLIEYLPDAPSIRPEKAYQHLWEKDELKKSFKTIYDWRSKSLHGGISFPAPVCESPMKYEKIFSEIPIGLAISYKNAVWVRKDIPMYLHLFEYIARNSLINWWKSLYSDETMEKRQL